MQIFKWKLINEYKYKFGVNKNYDLTILELFLSNFKEMLSYTTLLYEVGVELMNPELLNYIYSISETSISTKSNNLDLMIRSDYNDDKFVLVSIKLFKLELLKWLQSNNYRYNYIIKFSNKLISEYQDYLSINIINFLIKDGVLFTDTQLKILNYERDDILYYINDEENYDIEYHEYDENL